MRRVLAGVLVIVAAGSGLLWWRHAHGDGDLVTTSSPSSCSNVVVLGLRGQTQSSSAEHGVGSEVLHASVALASREKARGRTTALQAVRYDASAPATTAALTTNVAGGVRLLTSAVQHLESTCPSSRVVVLGYSEGADVVHQWAATAPVASGRQVAVVAMVADAVRNAADAVPTETFGRGAVTGSGKFGVGPRLPASVLPKAVGFCVKGDEVCNWQGRLPPGGGLSRTHREFYEGQGSVIAARIAAILR